MTKKGQRGFTLIELMVAIVIVGILGATAVPVYHTWLQRSYGQEATLMVKQIIDGQILYNLESNKYYSCDIFIDANDTSTEDRKEILDKLKVEIPIGHPLSYYLNGSEEEFTVIITADFALFKGGVNGLIGYIDSQGEIEIVPM